MPTAKPKRGPGSRGRYPVRSAAELEQIRGAYEHSAESVQELMRRFRMAGNELYALVAWHKWRIRGKDSRARKLATRSSQSRPQTPAEIARARKADDERREREAYAGVLEDANYLRRKGYAITVEAFGLYRVDRKQLTAAELLAVADRERRLERPAPLPVARIGRVTATATDYRPPMQPRKAKPAKPPAICEKCGGPRSTWATRLCRACYVAKPLQLKAMAAVLDAGKSYAKAAAASGLSATNARRLDGTMRVGARRCGCNRLASHLGRCWFRRGLTGPTGKALTIEVRR